MMTKVVYIICFTLIALISPKLTFACTEHQEKIAVETNCETDQHHTADEHSCCDTEAHDQPESNKDNSNCGDSTCCCPMMANHSCCLYSNPSFEFHFHIPTHREKISTLLVFQETTGYSSIFIPPKIV
ncbi:hypothetical protein [Sphingobacterium mizutaii]|uniref:hypothetical protein n=1 Tax=Sphingobacterium mizutaii TaxID=1010 RepID=UPI001626D476|nr:hypothetical protein [Sphingobacterium mizutaii]